jgi:hypothetical protein
MNILKLDTVLVISSVYAALSSVRPIKLKSITPFPGYSNRHALIDGGGVTVVVVGVTTVNIIKTNSLFSVFTHQNIHPSRHTYVLNGMYKPPLDLHLKLQILRFQLVNILM